MPTETLIQIIVTVVFIALLMRLCSNPGTVAPTETAEERALRRDTRRTQYLIDCGRPDAAWVFCRCRGIPLSPTPLEGIYRAIKHDASLRPRHRHELSSHLTWFLATVRAIAEAIEKFP